MVPSSQVRVTLTVSPLSGTKSLKTVKVAELRVLVIVQSALPFSERATVVVQPEAV